MQAFFSVCFQCWNGKTGRVLLGKVLAKMPSMWEVARLEDCVKDQNMEDMRAPSWEIVPFKVTSFQRDVKTPWARNARRCPPCYGVKTSCAIQISFSFLARVIATADKSFAGQKLCFLQKQKLSRSYALQASAAPQANNASCG